MTSLPLLLRVALTVAFVAAGGFCVRRCVVGGVGANSRLDDTWHVVMTVLMVAALWAVPRFPDWQAAMLAVACGWFVVRAVTRSPAAVGPIATGHPPEAGVGRAPATGTWHLREAATGPGPRAGGCADDGHHGGLRLRCAHHAILMALCAWMIAGPALSGGTGMPGMRTPGAAGTTVGWALAAAYCMGVSVLLLIGWVRGRGQLAHAVMAAGMGAMLAAMS